MKWLRLTILAISLLLLAFQCTVWAADYRWGHLAVLYLRKSPGPPEYTIVEFDRGVWEIHRFRTNGGLVEGIEWTDPQIGPFLLGRIFHRREYPEFTPRPWRELLLPEFEPMPNDRRHPGWHLQIPAIWTVALNLVPVAICLAPAIRARRRQSRATRGQCVRCGYDLRASPARCPECGETTPAHPTPSISETSNC